MTSAAPLVLSKYERVQILAARVEQLLAGAPRLVDIDTDDVAAIAEEEIARRILPMRVARALPNSKVRVHDLRDFIDPNEERRIEENLVHLPRATERTVDEDDRRGDPEENESASRKIPKTAV